MHLRTRKKRYIYKYCVQGRFFTVNQYFTSYFMGVKLGVSFKGNKMISEYL